MSCDEGTPREGGVRLSCDVSRARFKGLKTPFKDYGCEKRCPNKALRYFRAHHKRTLITPQTRVSRTLNEWLSHLDYRSRCDTGRVIHRFAAFLRFWTRFLLAGARFEGASITPRTSAAGPETEELEEIGRNHQSRWRKHSFSFEL